MVVPFARFPCAPDFDLLIADALALRDIDTIYDQRMVDAGVAAEYFLTIRKQYRDSSLGIPPVLPPTPVHVAPFPADTNMHSGLSSLPLARQNHVILHMMFSLMSPELLVRYQLYETPADVLNSVSTWESDLLHSSSPLIEEQLRSALMGNSERVEAFFWRVRGYCEELHKAGILVEQNYAMWIIVNGIRLARFDPLRRQYGLQKLKGGALEY